MNRHQRRAAKAKGKSAKIDPVVAIHEAGHAVARYLTAEDLGYATDQVISYIDVSPTTSGGRSVDGTMSLTLQATTYGPMLSKEIQEIAAREFADIMKSNQFTMEHAAQAVAIARSEGADISKWLRTRILTGVFGAAAEAKFLGQALEDVWGAYETEGDMRDAVQDCFLAGVTEEDAIQTFIDEAHARAATLIEQPEVWRAVVVLADSLPESGKFYGKQVAAIIRAAMEH
jgi:hypothetical protein